MRAIREPLKTNKQRKRDASTETYLSELVFEAQICLEHVTRTHARTVEVHYTPREGAHLRSATPHQKAAFAGK